VTADWTDLGITALLAALVASGAVSALLSWRLPMTTLASAVIAAGTLAGLVLLFGQFAPGYCLIIGGFAAAGAGLLYDRALIPVVVLFIIDAVIAAAVAAFYLPLGQLGASFGLAPVILVIAVALLVALLSLWLCRCDRIPGYPAAITAFAGAIGTFLAVWRDVPDWQAIWWLAALAATALAIAIISRARATPLGATGTGYLALTTGILLINVIALAVITV